MCGGHSQAKQDNDGKVLALVQKHKSDLETHLGAPVNQLEVVSFTTQVVNGTNYKVNVKVNGQHNGELVIYQTLPHMGSVTSVTSFKKL